MLSLARSPFVATSGHGDSFGTAQDLINNIDKGLVVEKWNIPVRRYTASWCSQPDRAVSHVGLTKLRVCVCVCVAAGLIAGKTGHRVAAGRTRAGTQVERLRP